MLRECKFIPALETPRLILRKLTSSDVPDLNKWLGREEVYTYWGRSASKGEKNPELLFYDPRPHVQRKPSPDFIWGIEFKETREVIGMIEVFDIENDRIGMVGYRVSPDFWNRGICTEALRHVVDFIFHKTNLDRLQASADIRNTASNKVLEKCGFRLEGTIRHGKMVSVFCDYNIWGLIRDDMK